MEHGEEEEEVPQNDIADRHGGKMVVSGDRYSEKVVHQSNVGEQKNVHVPNGRRNGSIAFVRYDRLHRQKETIVNQVFAQLCCCRRKVSR